MRRFILVLLLGVGLVAGGAGALFSSYSPKHNGSPNYPSYGQVGFTQSEGEMPTRIERRVAESDLRYLRRANAIIHRTTFHCEHLEPHVFAQDFMVKLLGRDRLLSEYGVISEDFKCGYCHQRAYRLVRAVRHEVDIELLGVSGHVIAVATVEGVRYGVDPDYGVGPFQMSDLDPDVLRNSVFTLYESTASTAGERDIVVNAITDGEGDSLYNVDYLMGLELEQDRFFGRVSFVQASLAFISILSLALMLGLIIFKRLRLNGKP